MPTTCYLLPTTYDRPLTTYYQRPAAYDYYCYYDYYYYFHDYYYDYDCYCYYYYYYYYYFHDYLSLIHI